MKNLDFCSHLILIKRGKSHSPYISNFSQIYMQLSIRCNPYAPALPSALLV